MLLKLRIYSITCHIIFTLSACYAHYFCTRRHAERHDFDIRRCDTRKMTRMMTDADTPTSFGR